MPETVLTGVYEDRAGAVWIGVFYPPSLGTAKIYVFKNNPYTDDWFHRWGLLYKAGKHYWFGLNLKAHRHVADYIDLRVLYSWR